MIVYRHLLACFIFATLIMGERSGFAAETCNRVVAIVNDEVITLHELNKKIKDMTGVNPDDLMSRDRNMYLETRRRVLELLIDDKIAREKIEELGITISPEEIDAAIETIKKDNQWTQEDLIAGLSRQGLSYETYREQIQKDLERIRLIDYQVKSKIIIGEERLKAYYEEHKHEFTKAQRVRLAHIFFTLENANNEYKARQVHEKAEEILSRLNRGEDFTELAREFSDGPGASAGGDLGVFDLAHLEPGVRKILEGMPEGAFSDLIVRPGGIQIIKLLERQREGKRSFEEARDAIYAILYKDEVNKRYMDWLKDLRESSYTKIIF
jgi:peptidyl-prolyl cis-trans isomerase SurA